MKQKKLKNIFLSSIHMDAGKTTISIGLYKALCQKRLKTAFMKPVGQQFLRVGELNIDKDSYLIAEVFRTGKKFKEMSPVTIGRGYTEKYIFNPHKSRLKKKIEDSFKKLTRGKDAIVVEGTGHAGVGSVIDFSNADVARLLGSKTIIICEGGIGRSIDEIALNKALFDLKGVEILGVIVNKVHKEKYGRIKRTLNRGLANKGLKLLGVIPYDPLLRSPTVGQVKNRLNMSLLCGQENLLRRVQHNIVAAMEPHNMMQYIKEGTLVLTSGDRVDNILAAISSHLVGDIQNPQVSGIILTGGLLPHKKIIDLLKQSNIPVLLTNDDTYSVAANVEHLVPKILKTDKDKIRHAENLFKKYVNVDYILKNL